jgi:nucleoid-associated protein
MELQEAILHRIIKAENTTGANAATVVPRNARLPIDERLVQTADNALRIYARATNGFGTFDANQVRYQFPVLLQKYVVRGADFIQFSNEATSLIAAEMGNAYFANGGYVLFLRYTNLGQDWLLIVMLKLKAGTGIDQVTLNLNETLFFDIDHLHEAARIDLGKWQANTQPYLSFIKKRRGSEDVTKYFRQALGCTEYTDSKHNTAEVMKAVNEFSETKGWTVEQRNEARRRTFEYCETKDRAREPVNLMALSAHIFDQEPTAFADYVREKEYVVSETFMPHRTTYTRFKRIDAKVGNIKVSFDVDDLVQQRVDYDSANNCLIINNLPQDLVDRINKIKPNDATSD